MMTLPTLRLWRDEAGHVVIAQPPNVPILGWAACAVVARLLGDGSTRSGIEALGRAFLFLWAYLEVTSGVNWFRRALGAVVLAAVVIGYVAG